MYKTKKRILSALSLLLAMLMLASCRAQTPSITETPAIVTEPTALATATEVTTTEAAPVLPEGIVLAGPDQTTVCTVTYPAGNSRLQAAAESLVAYINANVADAALSAVAE